MLYLVSVLDVEMALRTEQSNVSSRHDGADYDCSFCHLTKS